MGREIKQCREVLRAVSGGVLGYLCVLVLVRDPLGSHCDPCLGKAVQVSAFVGCDGQENQLYRCDNCIIPLREHFLGRAAQSDLFHGA